MARSWPIACRRAESFVLPLYRVTIESAPAASYKP